MVYSSRTCALRASTCHQSLVAEVTHSNDGECFSTPHRRLKTPQFCAKIFYTSNNPQSRTTRGLRANKLPASYPLSINTRIARERRSKNNHKSKTTTERRLQQFIPAFSTHSITEFVIKKRLSGGWPHCVNHPPPLSF